jgi:hypothetical protein
MFISSYSTKKMDSVKQKGGLAALKSFYRLNILTGIMRKNPRISYKIMIITPIKIIGIFMMPNRYSTHTGKFLFCDLLLSILMNRSKKIPIKIITPIRERRAIFILYVRLH